MGTLGGYDIVGLVETKMVKFSDFRVMKSHKVAALAASVITDKGGRSGGAAVLCSSYFTTQKVDLSGWMPPEATGRVAA